MSITYTNINKDLSLAFNSAYQSFSRNELTRAFEQACVLSGWVNIEWVGKKNNPYVCRIEKEGSAMNLIMYLKNITGAGWESKPWIKRVQVPNIRMEHPDYYVNTTNNCTVLILGYYNHDNNPIFVGWDAYDYVVHSTQRSCYVEIDDLREGYKLGYYKGKRASQRIWVFKPEKLNVFLNDYVATNLMEV